MTSFLVAFNNKFLAEHYLTLIRQKLTSIAEDGKLTVEDVEKEIKTNQDIKSHPVLKRITPQDPKKLRELSRNVFSILKSDILNEANDPDPLEEETAKYAILTFVSFAKFSLNKLYPIIEAALTSDSDSFNKEVKGLLGINDVPHENNFHEIIDKLQEVLSPFARQKTLTSLQELINSEPPKEASNEEVYTWSKEWFNALEENILSIAYEIPEDTRLYLLEKIKLIAQKEAAEVMKAVAANQAESQNPQDLLRSLISNVDDPELQRQLIRQMEMLGLGASLQSSFNPNNKKEITRTQDQLLKNEGWGNGYGKWIVSLGSALLSLGSYAFSEERFKNIVFGLGTFGLGGVLASAFKPIRQILGFDNKSPNLPVIFFDNNLRKWLITGISALLTGIGYYINENKLKTLVFGAGTLGLGGVLAANFNKVRDILGFPGIDKNFLELLRSFGIEITQGHTSKV